MRLVVERPYPRYGNAIFAHPSINLISTGVTENQDVEILTVYIEKCTITSTYKPPNINFEFNKSNNYTAKDIEFVIGDFNSHSTCWRYPKTNENGYTIEEWAEHNYLS